MQILIISFQDPAVTESVVNKDACIEVSALLDCLVCVCSAREAMQTTVWTQMENQVQERFLCKSQSVCLFVCFLFVCLFVYLFVRLFVCLFV